jgi:hypothetical protein
MKAWDVNPLAPAAQLLSQRDQLCSGKPSRLAKGVPLLIDNCVKIAEMLCAGKALSSALSL